MKTIKEVSIELSISKNTLRYYDEIDLVKPVRNSNQYRYYTEENIVELKYILVLKYGGMSLNEIKKILYNRRNKCNIDSTVSLLNNKKEELVNHIEKLSNIIKLLDVTTDLIDAKVNNDDTQIKALVSNIFNSIKDEEIL